jgi:hypothetical protein
LALDTESLLIKRLSILVPFMAELLLWLLPAAGFLTAYVLQFGGPTESIAPHLELVGSLGAAWLGLRLVLEHSGTGRTPRTVFQLLYSLVLACLLLYYATILVGLDNWGRVATWRLIRVYLDQWRELAAVLDVPVASVPLAFVLLWIAIFFIVRFAQARLPWPRRVATFTRLRMSIVLGFAAIVPFNVLAFEAYAAADRNSGEPVMLSLNPGAGTEATQHSRSEGARELDQLEAQAAAAYKAGTPAEARNVVLVVGDALRAGHMSVLGYARDTTPYLHSLAESGRLTVARRMLSVCAESYCGLMGIARSKFVHEFSRESLTMTQALARSGFRIDLILGGDHTNFYGLADALGSADLYWDGSMSGSYVNDDRAVIERAAALPEWDGRPTYLQFHLMSSHGLGMRHEEYQRFKPARNYYRRISGADDEMLRNLARNYYDDGLLQFDAYVKELLGTLEGLGYLDNALVIITGDHGELLGEHGRFGHAETVYRQVLDVPFLMLRYGYVGQDIAERDYVSQVDIAPTVFEELGLPVPPHWSGVGMHDHARRDYLYFQQGREVGLLDLRDPRHVWKFWVDLGSEAGYAFDTARNAGETDNRIADVPARLHSEWMLKLLPASNTFAQSLLADPLKAN